MSWIAIGASVAGAVVSAGVGAAVQSANAPGTASAAPLKFDPIDVNKVQSDALDASNLGYDLADKDFLARFPGLVAGNQTNISDAYKQLTGPLDPTVQNTFATNAAISALRSTGGGDASASIGGAGSATQNQFSTSILNQTQQKQDYDRGFLDYLISQNPQRAFGLSGSDAASLSIANVQGQNAYNQQKYQQNVAQKNASGGGGF